MDRKQAAYVLPLATIRLVKQEAADRDVYPAEVVAEALEVYFRRRKPEDRRERRGPAPLAI